MIPFGLPTLRTTTAPGLRADLESLEGVLTVTYHRNQGDLCVVVVVDHICAKLDRSLSALSAKHGQAIHVKESPRIMLGS